MLRGDITIRLCQTCGACCVLPNIPRSLRYIINLTASDIARLPRTYRKLVINAPDGRVYMGLRRTPDGFACVAFRGQVGRPCACAIYDQRPETCRRYRPGSRDCQNVRAAHGLL